MRGKTKKATFNLHTDVLTALEEASQGATISKNALVEQALLKELNELRKQSRRKLWQQAAKDALFIKDVKDVEDDFNAADAETARKIG
jgi:hypothetical protein